VSQKFAAVKGMNDLLPGQIEIWQHIEATARETLGRFGYSEIRTPMLEDTALFVRSVGEETDIVGKEMYTFEDKGGRSLSLRPEGTAPAARAYIEASVWNQEPLTRWFYVGPMFRYERMKTGRYRQFSQIGAEAYGVKEPGADVEIMESVVRFLEALELKDVKLHLNSLGDDACRPEYQKQLVAYFESRRANLCADCQRRLDTNPLRILDCKNPQCQEIAKGAPKVLESLCAPCREHFDEVQKRLTAVGVTYEIDPGIVRGLDYYTRTAFEFIASHPVLGTASTVGGGGRYDKLVKTLGGPDVPAVGFGLGLDRLALLLSESGRTFVRHADLFVAVAEESAAMPALALVSRLRKAGHWVEMDTRGGSLKSQMKRADKVGARYALVLGGKELESGQAQLKPMRGGEPRNVALTELEGALKG
jgi:histidyl-tRNA synthetase